MFKKFFSLIAVIVGLTLMPGITLAAGPFYEGKTVRIVTGGPAGGGLDLYSRVIARHMGKYIPGHPAIFVENMTGAGTLIACKYVYSRAKPDGLTIGNFVSQLVLAKVLGQEEIDFDIRKFEWIGVPVQDTLACALTKACGVPTMEEWMTAKTPVKLGGTTPGSSPMSDTARFLKALLNLPVHVVEGYKGTSDIRLAAESGEIAGGCWQWESLGVTWSKAIASGDVVVVLQVARKAHPDLPDVPLITNFTKTEEENELIMAGLYEPTRIARLYSLPPGTPKERVMILRKAFQDTMKDPDFLAEAKKSKLYINPMSGEEVKEIVNGLFNLRPSAVAKLKEIIFPRK